MRVWVVGFRVEDSGFSVQGLGFIVQDEGERVHGLSFELSVQGVVWRCGGATSVDSSTTKTVGILVRATISEYHNASTLCNSHPCTLRCP